MIRVKLIIKYHHESGNKSPGIIIEDKKGIDIKDYLSCFHNENEVILFPFTFLKIIGIIFTWKYLIEKIILNIL